MMVLKSLHHLYAHDILGSHPLFSVDTTLMVKVCEEVAILTSNILGAYIIASKKTNVHYSIS